MKKPYLIMIPGWGMKKNAWQKISSLLSKNFKLIFIEWDNIYSLDEFKNSVINTIKELNIKSFSLLGWSLGSIVSIDIALNSSLNIDSIILIGGTSCFTQKTNDNYNIGWEQIIVERMKLNLEKNKEKTLLNFYNTMFSPVEKESKKEFLNIINNDFEDKPLEPLLLGLDYLIEMDLKDTIKNLNLKTLLIHGSHDSICPLKGAIYIYNITEESSIHIINNAGHIPFFTTPYECYDAILNFIKKED